MMATMIGGFFAIKSAKIRAPRSIKTKARLSEPEAHWRVASEHGSRAAGAQFPELTVCSMRITSTARARAVERSSAHGASGSDALAAAPILLPVHGQGDPRREGLAAHVVQAGAGLDAQLEGRVAPAALQDHPPRRVVHGGHSVGQGLLPGAVVQAEGRFGTVVSQVHHPARLITAPLEHHAGALLPGQGLAPHLRLTLQPAPRHLHHGLGALVPEADLTLLIAGATGHHGGRQPPGAVGGPEPQLALRSG